VLEALGVAAVALFVLVLVALTLATGTDDAETAAGKLGGVAATALVRPAAR
jgi:hypothetical protein